MRGVGWAMHLASNLVVAKDAAKHPAMYGTSLHNKELAGPKCQ